MRSSMDLLSHETTTTGENYFKNSHLFKKIFVGTVEVSGTLSHGMLPPATFPS